MTRTTRRSLLKASAASAAAAAFPAHTFAAASVDSSAEIGWQVPFYRSRVGSTDITVVSDGKLAFPTTTLWPEVPEDELESFLSDFYQPTDSLPLQVNAMVIDLNGRRVLIEAGSGQDKFQPTAGGLPENLQAAGIHPETIDTVVFTHLHPDHLWGVTDAANEALTFPNAEYVAAQPEHAFWSDPDLPGQLPEGFLRELAQTTLAHLARIEDRLRTADVTAEVSPGITFIPAHGHTPGHVALMLESDGETLLSTGDVIANSVVNLERPEWAFGFDMDMEQGIASRQALLDQAASDRLRTFAYHLPWPGFGHVARQGEAYRWIPEEWDWRA